MNHKEKIHAWLKERIEAHDTVVDATCGNGHDTLFLSTLTDHVHAIDIQIEAIESTRLRVGDAITYWHMDHKDFKYPGLVRATVFNLGYLPGSNKSIITTAASTIPAITSALDHSDYVVIACYLKHEGGLHEYQAVKALLASYQNIRIETLTYETALSPVTFLITKEHEHASR